MDLGNHSQEPGYLYDEPEDSVDSRIQARKEEYEQGYQTRTMAPNSSPQRTSNRALPPPPVNITFMPAISTNASMLTLIQAHSGHLGKRPAKIELRGSNPLNTAMSYFGYGTQQDQDPKKLQKDFDKAFKAEAKRLGDSYAAETAHWKSEAAHWKSEAGGWKSDSRSRQNTISQQNQKIRDLEMERSTLNQRIIDLQSSLQDQESLVFDAQSKALQMLDKAEWTPQEDAKTRQELNGLEKLIRNWCKNNTIEKIRDWESKTISERDLENLRSDWGFFSLVPEKGFPVPQGFEDQSMDSKAWVLMAAWLTDFVYAKIFDTPFFFLEEFMKQVQLELGDTRKESSKLNFDMTELMDKLQKCKLADSMSTIFCLRDIGHGRDSKDVQHFRSQFLRLLDTPIRAGATKGLRDMQQTTAIAKKSVASNRAKQFFTSCEPFLNSVDMVETHRLLLAIITTATDLSTKLWTQRSYLLKEYVLRQPFHKDNKVWTPSGLHTAELDEDENALEGKTILMVLHPSVIAYGDSEGTNYATRRILKKAVVWMHGGKE